MEYSEIKNEKAISEINQFITSINKNSQEKIPINIRQFFEKNDTHKREHLIDFENFNPNSLEEETKAFFAIIKKYIAEVEYQNIKPDWKELEMSGRNKEAIKQLDLELATNFFNISNFYSDRKMTKIDFIYNIRFFGKSFNEEKNKKLEPYKALCNVFCIVHDKYKNVEKIEDINEALNMYKYIEHELKCLM